MIQGRDLRPTSAQNHPGIEGYGGLWRTNPQTADQAIRPSQPPIPGAPGRIRTCDARFRKPTLYPLSYEGKST